MVSKIIPDSSSSVNMCEDISHDDVTDAVVQNAGPTYHFQFDENSEDDTIPQLDENEDDELGPFPAQNPVLQRSEAIYYSDSDDDIQEVTNRLDNSNYLRQ
jgi:hypothetical protein